MVCSVCGVLCVWCAVCVVCSVCGVLCEYRCICVLFCAVLPQDTLVKQNLIRSMDLIGRSLHIDHLKKTFVFNKRVDLINHLLVSGRGRRK